MSKEVGEMVRSRDVVQAEGSARTEGARRATGVRADGAAAGAGSLAPGQRWSASRKRDVVLRLLRGESLEALSREAGVEIYRLEAWRERAMAGPRTRLKGSSRRASGGGARRGEASHRGAVDGRSSCSESGPGPRSSASLWRCGGRDDERDARLRILDGIRVARTRVLRVMRAHGLLSQHRGRQGAAKTHDGRVITQAPNVMWGTDGVRVFTLDDGWGWIFAAVEHWNAECVGWHVCKVGSRFAALDPIAQGLERRYGSLDADVARGLALRMDHGSQYLSDHFLKQIRYWGIHPSFGFVEEPETNGVAERWNRTLKEQAIHGRIFKNLETVRAAVADFVERYNQTWRLEKLGYQTPIEAREEYELRQAA